MTRNELKDHIRKTIEAAIEPGGMDAEAEKRCVELARDLFDHEDNALAMEAMGDLFYEFAAELREREYLGIREVAGILNLHPHTVRQKIVDGTIKGTRQGKGRGVKWLVKRTELERLLDPKSLVDHVADTSEPAAVPGLFEFAIGKQPRFGGRVLHRLRGEIHKRVTSWEDGRGQCGVGQKWTLAYRLNRVVEHLLLMQYRTADKVPEDLTLAQVAADIEPEEIVAVPGAGRKTTEAWERIRAELLYN